MAKKRIDREKNIESGTVTFTVIETGAKLECDVTKLFPQYADFSEVQRQAVIHAINAKVGDSAANPKEDALTVMTSTWENVLAGDWNVRGTGEGSTRTTLLAEAVQRVTGQEMDAVTEKLNSMSDEEKKALRDHAAVKAMMTTIKAERAQAAAKAAAKAAKSADALNF